MPTKPATFRLKDESLTTLKTLAHQKNQSQSQVIDLLLLEAKHQIIKKPFVTVYGLRTKNHIHYVGSTYNYLARIVGHRGPSGADKIKQALAKGAEFFVIQECDPEEGFLVEKTQIETLRKAGMCELNHRLPSVNQERTQTGHGNAIKSTETGKVFPSRQAAAREYNVSGTTILAWLRQGRFKEYSS